MRQSNLLNKETDRHSGFAMTGIHVFAKHKVLKQSAIDNSSNTKFRNRNR